MALVNLRVSLAAGIFLAACAHAGVIYTAVDLDTQGPSGSELWQYIYTFQNYVPQQNVAIEILFDPLQYTNLQNPPPAVSGWSIVALQPDLGFGDPGRYSALALENNAPLTGPFTVTFGWLGQGSPGSQPVELNQFSSEGGFIATVGTEETSSAVPEPATALLIGSALVLVALYLRLRLPSLAKSDPRNRTAAGNPSRLT